MTILSSKQEALLEALGERTREIASIHKKIAAETESIEWERKNIIRDLMKYDNTPLSRIGAIVGISYAPKIKKYVMDIVNEPVSQNPATPEQEGAREVNTRRDGDKLTVSLRDWPGLGSGEATFTLVEGEWLPNGLDSFTQSVERALFGDTPDADLRRAVDTE